MTSSRRYGRILQAASLGFIGMLTVVGCGGSETRVPDGGSGMDTAPPAPFVALNVPGNPIDFGSVDVGAPASTQTFVVTNSGTGAASKITLAPSAGLTATGCATVLAAKSTCTVTVGWAPTAAGKLNGSVVVSAVGVTPVSVAVLGTAVVGADFSVSPASIPLGSVEVGKASTQTITVTNNKAVALPITVGLSGQDITKDPTSTCGASLPANGTCTVVVIFKAATNGVKSDSVSVSGNGVVKDVPISATAMNPAKLGASPTLLTLAAIAGQTDSKQVVVVNQGDMPTGVVTAAITGAGLTVAAAPECLAPIPGAKYCTFTVTYSPLAATTAPVAGTLTITDPGATSATVTIQATASSISAPTITGSGDFGNVVLGATSAATTYTVTNPADAPTGALTVAGPQGAFVKTSDTCTGVSLAKGATCTVAIQFKPAAVGLVSGLFSVTGAGGTGSKALTGTGTPVLTAGLSLSPLALDFGDVRVNSSGTLRVVTVTNNGGAATGPLTFTKTGTFGEFPVTGNTCSAALAPATSCTFSVNFAPVVAGSKNAVIVVTDGAVSGSLSLAGNAMAATGLTITPATVRTCVATPTHAADCFPATVVGGTNTTGVSFTVQMDATLPAGTADSGAITVALAGANAADFTISSNDCATTVLGANGTCLVVVDFTPGAASLGLRSAVLNVTTANGGAGSASLQSTGLPLVELAALATDDTGKGIDFGGQTNGTEGKVLKYRMTVRGATDSAVTSTIPTVDLPYGNPSDFRNVDVSPMTANAVVPGTSGVSIVESDVNRCSATTGLGLTALTGVATGAPPSAAWTIVNGEWVCDFYVQFYPQSGKSETPKSVVVTASASAGGSAALTLTGTSTGPLVFSPITYAFDDLTPATSSTTATVAISMVTITGGVHTFTLTNNGPIAQAGIIVTLGGANADEFGITFDGCTTTTLAPAGTCTVNVGYFPKTVGSKVATLNARATGGETALANITAGASIGSPVTVTPSDEITFPTVIQTKKGEWQTVTISNPAAGKLSGKLTYEVTGEFELYTLTTANVSAYPTGFCGDDNTKQLAPGSSCIIQVRFAPLNTTAPTVVREGTLTVSVGGVPMPAIDLKGTPSAQLTVSTAALDFGNVAQNTQVSKSTTVTNNGLTTLAIAIPNLNTGDNGDDNTSPNPPPLSVVPGSAATPCNASGDLAAGASCTLTYQYTGSTPGTSVGVTTPATIRILSDAAGAFADLTYMAKSVNPAALALYGFDDYSDPIQVGDVTTSSQGGVVEIWFQNTGDVAATGVTATLSANTQFAFTTETLGDSCNTLPNQTLAGKAKCRVHVQLAPSGAAGAKTGTLTVSGTGLAGVDVDLSGLSHGAAAAGVYLNVVGATTTYATLAATAVDATKVAYFEVHNNSGGDLDLADLDVDGPSSDFSIVAGSANSCPSTIPAGAVCQIGVQFAPTDYGNVNTDGQRYRWTAVTVSGAQAAGVMAAVLKPALLTLTGASTAAVTVTVDSSYPENSSVNFGEVVVQQSASFTFTITNVGETATAGAVTTPLDANDYVTVTNTCGTAVLQPNATCTATVVVSGAVGEHEGTTLQAVVAANTDQNSSEIYNVLATFVNPAALTITSPETDFGSIYVSDTSTLTFTITNGAANQQTSGKLVVALSDSTNFKPSTTASSCYVTDAWTTLDAGESCELVVTFSPTTAGTKNSTLSVSAAPGGAVIPVALTGVGLSDLVIDAATDPVVMTSSQLFTVTNMGSSATLPLRPVISGTSADQFVLTLDNCYGQALAAGNSCTITMQFIGTSSATTAQTATLTVSDGDANNTAVANVSVGGPS